MSNLSQSALMTVHSILKAELSLIRVRRWELKRDIAYCYKRAEKGSAKGEAYFAELNMHRSEERWYKAQQKKIARVIKELKSAMK